MPQRPPDFGSFRSDDLNAHRQPLADLSQRAAPPPYSRQQRRQLLQARQRSIQSYPQGFRWRSSLGLEELDLRGSVSQTFSLIVAMTLMGAGLPLLITPRLEATRLGPIPVKASQPVVALRRAIIAKESDTNHRAINPDSKAIGYAQILPENLPYWSQEVFGREISQAEFLSDPDLQVQIIEYMLDKYLREELQANGENEAIAIRKVASRWYAGRADLFDSPKPQFYGGVRYPSVKDYTQSILKKYRQERRQ